MSVWRRSRQPALGLLLLLAALLVGAPLASAVPQTGDELSEPSELDPRLTTMRSALVELRFEEAVSLASALLADADVPREARIAAFRVRIAANLSLGQRQPVERDFRALLQLDPAYQPDQTTTPSRMLDRFREVRNELIAVLLITVQPADARITIDGIDVTDRLGEPLPLLAGDHELEATHPGFAADRRTVRVSAGGDLALNVEMVQVARSLVVETTQAAVEVLLDGRSAGVTAGDGDAGPARLALEWLPLGEYRVELRKPCHRSQSVQLLLTIDLLDRGPVRLGPLDLLEVRSTLRPDGGPPGATLLVDGESVGALPLERLDLCPGEHLLELRVDGRSLWRTNELVGESEDRAIRIEPRPNAVLFGADAEHPWVRSLGRRFNVDLRRAAPPAGDLGLGSGWRGIALPADTDLVLARRRDAGRGESWFVYSPTLRTAARFVPDRVDLERRPSWTAVSWGLSLVDSAVGGPAQAVIVVPRGPAAAAGVAAGDRLLEIGGVSVDSAAVAERLFDLASAGAPLETVWRRALDGKRVAVALNGETAPALPAAPRDPWTAMLRAAWAATDAAADPARRSNALANLALLLSEAGRTDAAVVAWRRVGWPERPGIGAGTVAYFLGRDLERAGREDEAVAAYRLAAGGRATAFADDGPAVAPAARDRLADLGRSVSAR